MPPKKKEAALFDEVTTQEEWESLMEKEGLWVIDVYQDWSGPCNAIHGNFRRIKNDTADDLLQFALAKIDNIDALKDYRGRCEPCFLFYAGGKLVSFVHGANSPLVLRTILEQLDHEHKVKDGLAERIEVQDSFIIAKRKAEKEAKKAAERERRLENEQLAKEGFTVAIIKPNVLKAGKVDELMAELEQHHIEILTQEERSLTEEDIRTVYEHLKDEPFFEDLIRFMTSGPSRMLVLTKKQTNDEIIQEWRSILGPANVEEAKSTAPDSLRARFGMQGLLNGLHGSDSKQTATRELAFFFPSFQVPTIPRTPIQYTLAIIRPEAYKDKKDEILTKIKEAGFWIAMQKVIQLTKQQAEQFYSEHIGQPQFDQLIAHMSSGPALALGLAKSDAIDRWQSLLGPASVDEAKAQAKDSLRAQFAVDNVPINQLHGSDSAQSAKKELEFFFHTEDTVAVIKPDAYGAKDLIIERILGAGFLIVTRKETTITREIAEALYKEAKGAKFYEDLLNSMTSGTAMLMILSRLGAVDGWRQELGPTDPAVAKLEAPNSLRAQFGKDILHNGLYGAQTIDEAQKKIRTIFSKLDELPDEDIDVTLGQKRIIFALSFGIVDLCGCVISNIKQIVPAKEQSPSVTTVGSEHEAELKEAFGEVDRTSAAEETTTAQGKPADDERSVTGGDEGSPTGENAPGAPEEDFPATVLSSDGEPAPEAEEAPPETDQPASEEAPEA